VSFLPSLTFFESGKIRREICRLFVWLFFLFPPFWESPFPQPLPGTRFFDAKRKFCLLFSSYPLSAGIPFLIKMWAKRDSSFCLLRIPQAFLFFFLKRILCRSAPQYITGSFVPRRMANPPPLFPLSFCPRPDFSLRFFFHPQAKKEFFLSWRPKLFLWLMGCLHWLWEWLGFFFPQKSGPSGFFFSFRLL